MNPLLELDEVSAGIAGIRVLREISVRIEPGATVALVGRNGAGKTTLLRLLMGLIPCREGRIVFDGKDITRGRACDRARLGLGYAPEDRVLFPTLTVAANLRFPCEVQRLAASEIERRLDEVVQIVPELVPLLDRSAAALSGGQGKMAVLGRALMIGTRLVLLDEPFQGLAPVLAGHYAKALQTLQAARPELALIITESNARLLTGISAQTLGLERGALVG